MKYRTKYERYQEAKLKYEKEVNKMEENEGIKISDTKLIIELNKIQIYLNQKGAKSDYDTIIKSCVRTAKRLSADNWGIYLDIKHYG